MKPGPDAALFHPFETGELETPARAERVLFLGAEPGFRLPNGFDAQLTLVNGFRPSFLRLKATRHVVLPAAEGEGFDVALVLAGKHRGLNEARINDAWSRTRPEGTIVVAGGRQDGIESLRKRASGNVELGGTLSKHHGVVFWFHKAGDVAPMPGPEPHGPVDGRFETKPGMFSHDRVDPGSRLLAENLPDDIKGAVADFCAGWGYLSAELLARSADAASLDLYEADFASLEAARRNLSGAGVPTGFHWTDLTTEPVPRQYDLIVMNPPFHTGRAAEPSIGAALIAAAARALKPRGRLLLVANRGLPYEKALAAAFGRSGELCRDASFKVLWGDR